MGELSKMLVTTLTIRFQYLILLETQLKYPPQNTSPNFYKFQNLQASLEVYRELLNSIRVVPRYK